MIHFWQFPILLGLAATQIVAQRFPGLEGAHLSGDESRLVWTYTIASVALGLPISAITPKLAWFVYPPAVFGVGYYIYQQIAVAHGVMH